MKRNLPVFLGGFLVGLPGAVNAQPTNAVPDDFDSSIYLAPTRHRSPVFIPKGIRERSRVYQGPVLDRASALLLLRQRLREKATNFPPEITIMTDQLLEARAAIEEQEEELIKLKLSIPFEQWGAIDEKVKQCKAAKSQLAQELRTAIRERFGDLPIKSAATKDSPKTPSQP